MGQQAAASVLFQKRERDFTLPFSLSSLSLSSLSPVSSVPECIIRQADFGVSLPAMIFCSNEI